MYVALMREREREGVSDCETGGVCAIKAGTGCTRDYAGMKYFQDSVAVDESAHQGSSFSPGLH